MSLPGYYFRARRSHQGRRVDLIVHEGLREQRHQQIGAISFERDQWETFRPVLIMAIRAAGYARIPIDLMDETRGKPQVVTKH